MGVSTMSHPTTSRYHPKVMAIDGRRTKIVATWGPSAATDERIRLLLRAGVDVFRLNCSHANHDEIAEVTPRIHAIAAEEHRHVALLQDIQGPRIRTGVLANAKPVLLETGSIVSISAESADGPTAASSTHITVTYPRIAEDVSEGDRILIADGTIVLRAQELDEGRLTAKVEHGGVLGEHKGVNLPDSQVRAEPLTPKDISDLKFGAEINVDYVALSFVRRASDVEACRALLKGLGRQTPIISKIEHPLAIQNLEEILAASDGVMVARGDLGVEVSPERVPLLQKRIIRRANEVGIPVITATQMLESMVERPTPTRAEASDVANAILDGTDAVMLSAETAVGGYPVQTVETMCRIALETESAQTLPTRFERPEQAFLIAQSTVSLASSLDAKAVLVFTRSGRTAQTISLNKPDRPIYALTPHTAVARQLSLWYAVEPYVGADQTDVDGMLEHGIGTLREHGAVTEGDTVVIMGSLPAGPPNLINVRTVPA
jgi:pyruvate kinase